MNRRYALIWLAALATTVLAQTTTEAPNQHLHQLEESLQELGYIRSSAVLTNRYNEETARRVTLFQRQTGMSEDGVAWQELQAYLFSDKAPQCTQTLPRVRSRVADGKNRMICGCCMGEGCECCNFTGWVN